MIHKSNCFIVLLVITLFSLTSFTVKAASDTVSTIKSSKTDGYVEQDTINRDAPTELIITPTIGLGTGMFSFYGDLYNKHFQAPMVSRLAFDLAVSQPIKDYLQLNLYVLFGKLGANERFAPNNRNLNFESQIRAGGLNLEYNFNHFLPQKRTASPYVSLGIESFEFLSKTDVLDKNNLKYFYWSDGSIRNKDEFATDAGTSVEIFRDYTYESDVREMNLDGFGKYPERSFAIPVGAGVIFKINDFVNFKMGATMHFTFTDYIDGVTEQSIGNRQGSSRNDNFMMTSFSLHYNLGTSKRAKKKADAWNREENYRNVDFAALELDDQDKDGVRDWDDQCQGTPAGVPVDEKGCPLDDDTDGVPNYRDDELNSKKDVIVSIRGLTMSDSLIAYQYNVYMDSTGTYGLVDNRDPNSLKANQKEYTVELGTFKKGLPANLMTKFLSIIDISTASKGDSSTIYTAGKFDNIKDAEKRKQQLISEGLKNVKVVYKLNNKYYDPAADALASAKAKTKTNKTKGSGKDYSGKFVGDDNTPLANSKVNLVNEQGEIVQTSTTDGMGAFHFNYLSPDQNVLFQLDVDDSQLKKFKKVYLADNNGNKVREVYPDKSVFGSGDLNNTIAGENNSKTVAAVNNTARTMPTDKENDDLIQALSAKIQAMNKANEAKVDSLKAELVKQKSTEVVNEPASASITIRLVDEKGNIISDAVIKVIDVATQKVISTPKIDSDGYARMSVPSGKMVDILITKTGFLYKSFNVTPTAGSETPLEDVKLEKVAVGKKLVMNNIRFELNEAKLDERYSFACS